MKKNWRNSIAIAWLILVVIFACSKRDDHGEHTDVYTCSMHPTVISDKPGNCPVCGMDLVRKARSGEEIKISEDLGRLMKSPNEVVVASIKTIKPEFKSMPASINAVGVVTYDTRNIFTVPARVGGRVEKMYLKYEFQKVDKGQKIADVYSPELITAQRQLLYLLDNDSENVQLIEGAKRRLQLLGFSAAQIGNLSSQKQPSSTIAIYSPYSGYVITNGVTPPVSPIAAQPADANAMGGMTSTSSKSNATSESALPSPMLIREGDYVTAGQTLLKVVNTAALRLELDLPGAYAGLMRMGQRIQIDYGDGNMSDATVDLVQPFFNEGENFLKIRAYTPKVKEFHIGLLVAAKLVLPSNESLWVPREAVLDLGTSRIVFIKDREVLKPKKITTGIRSGDWIEVTGGLASSDEIAFNAQYLVDSESFIKPGN
jgi:membrane fusion protein, copper/silver efflux system